MTFADRADAPSEPALLLPGRGWGRVQDTLWRALSHHLNGRANALSGLVEVLERGDGGADITGHLRGEVDRITRVAGLLRVVVGPPGIPEVRVLSEMVEEVLALAHLQQGSGRAGRATLERTEDSAVRTDPVLLARLLLLLRALLLGDRPDELLEVTLEADRGEAVVTLRVPGEHEGEVGPDRPGWSELEGAASRIPGVIALVRTMGTEGSEARLSLRRLE